MSELRDKASDLTNGATETLILPESLGNRSPEFVAACVDSSKAMSLLAIVIHLDRIATALERG